MNGNPARQRGESRSATTVTVDNIIRRALRVSDPSDPAQLAEALLGRYEREADLLRREASGMPILRTAQLPIPEVDSGGGASRIEITQARNDLDRDLDALVHESQLKDIEDELRGWAHAIRAAARQGLASGRLALDSGERDRTFAARRVLAEYSRLARYLAALSGQVSGLFCKLAQSCDIMGHLMLVLAGEALASGGITRTSVLLQSPASELQTRREAALAALRNLTGTSGTRSQSGPWPRAGVALRQLELALQQAGAGDLRTFLDESYLSGIFDDLIALASDPTAEGLKALGATSVVTVARLERFVSLASARVRPSSPELAHFLSTLSHFIQSFSAARSGYRLTYVARPPLLFYGLYGARGADPATLNLLDLIEQRGRIAELVDCLCCGCDADMSEALAAVAKLLYDIDHAIDLLIQGTDPNGRGLAEEQAAAYGILIAAVLSHEGAGAETNGENGGTGPLTFDTGVPALADGLRGLMSVEPRIGEALSVIVTEELLFRADIFPPAGDEETANAVRASARRLHAVLCAQRATEVRFRRLVENMSPICHHARILGAPDIATDAHPGRIVGQILDEAHFLIETAVIEALNPGISELLPEGISVAEVHAGTVEVPDIGAFRDTEDGEIFVTLGQTDGETVIDFVPFSLAPCVTPAIDIPPHYETSLDSLANDVLLDGQNRGEVNRDIL